MEWAANDHCRAVYTEDGVEYEALVLSVDADEEGYRYAKVRFVGYGNEETYWLEELKPSKGEATRRAQTMKAVRSFQPETRAILRLGRSPSQKSTWLVSLGRLQISSSAAGAQNIFVLQYGSCATAATTCVMTARQQRFTSQHPSL